VAGSHALFAVLDSTARYPAAPAARCPLPAWSRQRPCSPLRQKRRFQSFEDTAAAGFQSFEDICGGRKRNYAGPFCQQWDRHEYCLEDFFGVFRSLSTGHGVWRCCFQDSVAVEQQAGFLFFFRDVAYFSRFCVDGHTTVA
jgi:hypothetical protein